MLGPFWRQHGQDVFRQIKRLDEVQFGFVPTCDEFFLSHALDEYRHLAKQAYFFALGSPASDEDQIAGYALRPAEKEDIETIRTGSGDFFGNIERSIEQQKPFMIFLNEVCAGFGIVDRSALAGDVASIGMFILEQYRRQGAGTATLRLLQRECRREGLRPIAGCWYYNHLSKKTLEAAGMYSQTRLLRIEY